MRYVAFLRGINLGKRRLSMSTLRRLFEQLGFTGVETFIASGNVIFSAPKAPPAKFEGQIAAHLQSSLGYSVDTFIRTAAQVVEISEFDPFPAERDPACKTHVAFLRKKLSPSAARQLQSIRTDYDLFFVRDSEFFWLTRGPISQSKVWSLPELKHIELPSPTMRNITSLRKLAARLQ